MSDNNRTTNVNQENIKKHAEQLRKNQTRKRAKNKNTPPATATPSNVLNADSDIAPPVVYDVDLLQRFLTCIFHAELDYDEEVLCYYEPAHWSPYPSSEDDFLSRISRTRKAAKLYVGTSTTHADTDGKLYNRLDLFRRLHFIVLDDIGTKIPADQLPEALTPTCIVETSQGNYQYMYVLDKPIANKAVARALLRLVYKSGFTDQGGATIMKKVRLPGGVNGKKDNVKRAFQVRLVDDQGPYWEPQALLDALELNVDWAELQADTAAFEREQQLAGTSPWCARPPLDPSPTGIVDPILEFLYDQHMVLSDNGEWVVIRCPWGDTHTDDNEAAYYSPVGRGSGIHQFTRGYRCFHSHAEVEGHNTRAFLIELALMGAPECAAFDPAAQLVQSHVYDSEHNSVWCLNIEDETRQGPPYRYGSLDAFKNTFNTLHPMQTLYTPTGDPKLKHISEASLFMSNPARVVVQGSTYAPYTRARVITEGNRQLLNEFHMTDHGVGPYDMHHVQWFLDYLDYLIPRPEQRDLVLEWLAAKYQKMSFRGWGILMVTPAFGTGRGTLANILTPLFGAANCADIDFPTLLNADKHNEWMAKAVVFCGESEAVGHGDEHVSPYKAYNQLKRVVDTTGRRAEINPKYGRKKEITMSASFLVSSNNQMAAVIPEKDRRMFIVENTSHPASSHYFTEINEKRLQVCDPTTGTPTFVPHLARYLQTLKVDLRKLNGPAPMTDAKAAVIAASRSVIDVAFNAIVHALPDGIGYGKLFDTVLIGTGIAQQYFNKEDAVSAKIIRTKFMNESLPVLGTARPYIKDLRDPKQRAQLRLRALVNGRAHDPENPTQIVKRLNAVTLETLKSKVIEALHEAEFSPHL